MKLFVIDWLLGILSDLVWVFVSLILLLLYDFLIWRLTHRLLLLFLDVDFLSKWYKAIHRNPELFV